MIGNIDPYVIAKHFSLKGRKKVSTLLKEYYLEAKGKKFREKRYTIFAREVGLITFDGKKFLNTKSWIKKYKDQINDSAALYFGANTGGRYLYDVLNRYITSFSIADNQGSVMLLDLLLKALLKVISYEKQQ